MPYIYHVPVSFDIPKANIEEKLADILLAYDHDTFWRIRTDIKLRCEAEIPPSGATVRRHIKDNWNGATDIDIWTGSEFFTRIGS